jgi:hypothetical protein
MQQLSCSYGGVALPDDGVPKWRPGWSRRGEVDMRTVAEKAKEEENGRGCGEERETDGGS